MEVTDHMHAAPIPPQGMLARLWAFARAGQQAAATIATRPGADDDLRWSTAAGHFGEAADELQRVRPDVISAVIPSLASELDLVPLEQATQTLAAGIGAALDAVDPYAPELNGREVLAIGEAATSLGMAHVALVGRLP
jgi:hypothetical protein